MGPHVSRLSRLLLAALLVLSLFVVQLAHGASSQPLSFSVSGSTVNAGDQKYTVGGGQVVFASVLGQLFIPSASTLKYNFIAEVNGLSTKGTMHLELAGTGANGQRLVAVGDVRVADMVPAAALPLGCTSACNSAIPLLFVGASDFSISIAGSTQRFSTLMQVESPYFNPFGGPIILASTDGSVIIVSTYTQGTIDWTGVQLGGVISGSVGGSQVTGNFNMTSKANEDLVRGTEQDQGTISFTSMNPTYLNLKGEYRGSSTIPTAGASDCSSITQFPGTCTETGFISSGQFWMNGKGGSVSGSYQTQWGVPALGFGGLVTGRAVKK